MYVLRYTLPTEPNKWLILGEATDVLRPYDQDDYADYLAAKESAESFMRKIDMKPFNAGETVILSRNVPRKIRYKDYQVVWTPAA